MNQPPSPASICHRPLLRPGVTITWRTDGSLLIGTRPGIRISGDTGQLVQLARLISGLDGTRTHDAVVDECLTDELMQALVAGGCLLDAGAQHKSRLPNDLVDACRVRVVDGDTDDPTVIAGNRHQANVLVVADPRIHPRVAELLTAAGVNPVSPTSSTRHLAAALAIEICDEAEPLLDASGIAREWVRNRIPHVVAAVSGTRISIGPLVIPGQSACTSCLRLAQDDENGTAYAWQARGHAVYQPVAHRLGLSADTLAIAAGLSVGRLLAAIDAVAGRGIAEHLLIDSAGRVITRQVSPHPDCGCQDAPASGLSARSTSGGLTQRIARDRTFDAGADAGADLATVLPRAETDHAVGSGERERPSAA